MMSDENADNAENTDQAGTNDAGANRRRRGSLDGQLVMAPDWGSDEVNDAIARDFG
jgi:hypothetical protein